MSNESDKEKNIGIIFELKSTENIEQNKINTLALYLRELKEGIKEGKVK